MLKLRTLLAAALILFAGNSASYAAEQAQISHDAYAFHTAVQQRNGAAFMTLKNSSDADLVLVSASSDIADIIEIHTMSMDDGIMEMRRLEELKIPANSDVVLEPTGKHIMLIGLREQLEHGKQFPLTLSFADGRSETIQIAIVPPGQKPSHHHH